MGSRHPEHGFIYPVNYGYVPGTLAEDGEEIDAYVLGEFEPLDSYEGIVIGIILRRDDNENKLVVSRHVDQYGADEIRALTEFQERFFDSHVISFAPKPAKQHIRTIVLGMVRNRDRVLAVRYTGAESDECFFRFPGGGVEYGESRLDTLRREFREELGTDILKSKYLGTIDNIFHVKENLGHELVTLYEVEIETRFYPMPKIPITENGLRGEAEWLTRDEVRSGAQVLYPDGVQEYA